MNLDQRIIFGFVLSMIISCGKSNQTSSPTDPGTSGITYNDLFIPLPSQALILI